MAMSPSADLISHGEESCRLADSRDRMELPYNSPDGVKVGCLDRSYNVVTAGNCISRPNSFHLLDTLTHPFQPCLLLSQLTHKLLPPFVFLLFYCLHLKVSKLPGSTMISNRYPDSSSPTPRAELEATDLEAVPASP